MENLAKLELVNVFNPYSQCCDRHDIADAPTIRKNMIRGIIDAAIAMENGVDSLWVGRDLGYRGGRRTGLAFTDDEHISLYLDLWDIKYESRPTKEVMSERTASYMWNVLKDINEKFFLWNVFPLHPFEPNNKFSNRAHNSKERHDGLQLLENVIEMLKPQKIIAVGNDAHKAVSICKPGVPVHKVRHPSYGGQSKFMENIRSIYNIDTNSPWNHKNLI